MKAFIFPGQGSQYPGMAQGLLERDKIKPLFEVANEVVGFDIAEIMFNGTAEDLKQTKVTQPAIFIHSVLNAKALGEDFAPQVVAGHSLGEFSALTAAGALSFEDGLSLVCKRANAMQKACELAPSTMAAVLGLEDNIVESVCAGVDEVVVAANFNCPGQVVISGSHEGVDQACEILQEKGARRTVKLPVGGAFHSPLMEPARKDLGTAIAETDIQTPLCPIYQNVDAKPYTDAQTIKENLIAQLTAPVRWSQTIQQMKKDGVTSLTEVGPGKVLQGLALKIDKDFTVTGFDKM